MKKYIVIVIVVILSLFGKISPDVFSSYKVYELQKGIYIVEIDNFDNSFVPYYVDNLEKNKVVYNREKPRFVVNTGYFEMLNDNQKNNSDSFVIIDGKIVLDPLLNPLLPLRADYNSVKSGGVYNRSEFRILENSKGDFLYDIAPHYSNVIPGYKIKHSMQGGPMLYPKFNLSEEYFLQFNEKGIMTRALLYPAKKMPRTVLAIKNNRVFLLIIDKSIGMYSSDLVNLIYQFGFDKAIGYDGCYSTAFDSKTYHIDGAPLFRTRKLKSFLMLK